MLRIAVPNKGSLSEAASGMLRESGYRQRSGRELVLVDPTNDVEFFFLRPRDIAVYVGSGRIDAGITGRDLLLDSGAEAEEIMALGFGRSTFRFAAPKGELTAEKQIAGLRIATSYPGLVHRRLAHLGVEAVVVRLDGAVESSLELGVADLIADVVETGSTLKAAGLSVFGEPLLESEAVLIARAGVRDRPSGLGVLQRRLQGVLVARQYVLFDYDVRVELVEQACALTPGLQSPTVSPLHDQGFVAVRAMVPQAQTNQVMDALYELGARAILVTGIHACRL